ncbi:toxin-antitoxin system TumE family protein [Arvimicrobium flavum]|uniref:toxin-antitoxin system TumE family protein n=1 Tax=Arvimicrobium flavum TaxID=3393320 RepID=UPI00237B813C|nr:DUF6516 family protein [Mesorhizobium shangrilense]
MPKRARLLRRRKFDLGRGYIAQVTIWELPLRTEERPHGLKYSLFFGRYGERIIGYDNEAGKGDHRHYREREEPYRFHSMKQLLADFFADVRKELDSE